MLAQSCFFSAFGIVGGGSGVWSIKDTKQRNALYLHGTNKIPGFLPTGSRCPSRMDESLQKVHNVTTSDAEAAATVIVRPPPILADICKYKEPHMILP